MAIKIEKTFIISEEESETLSNICELARRYIDKHKNDMGKLYLDEYDEKEIRKIEELMRDIFGN